MGSPITNIEGLAITCHFPDSPTTMVVGKTVSFTKEKPFRVSGAALLRLTDDGLDWFRLGERFAEEIENLLIGGHPALVKIAEFKTREEAVERFGKLSIEEKERTLIRTSGNQT